MTDLDRTETRAGIALAIQCAVELGIDRELRELTGDPDGLGTPAQHLADAAMAAYEENPPEWLVKFLYAVLSLDLTSGDTELMREAFHDLPDGIAVVMQHLLDIRAELAKRKRPR